MHFLLMYSMTSSPARLIYSACCKSFLVLFPYLSMCLSSLACAYLLRSISSFFQSRGVAKSNIGRVFHSLVSKVSIRIMHCRSALSLIVTHSVHTRARTTHPLDTRRQRRKALDPGVLGVETSGARANTRTKGRRIANPDIAWVTNSCNSPPRDVLLTLITTRQVRSRVGFVEVEENKRRGANWYSLQRGSGWGN